MEPNESRIEWCYKEMFDNCVSIVVSWKNLKAIIYIDNVSINEDHLFQQ